MGTGILSFLRPLIGWIYINSLYFGGYAIAVASIFKKAEWGLMLLVALIPLPTLWYPLYNFSMGGDLLNVLFLSIMWGIIFNKKGYTLSGNSIAIMLFIIMSYLSLWICSINYSLPLPITTDNPVIKIWKNYVFMIFTYFFAFNAIKDEKWQKRLILVMSLVVLFIAIKSLRNFTAGSSFADESRDAGPFWIVFLNSNHFGAFIAYCFSFFLGLSLLEKDKKRKLLYLATAASCLHPLFFSYSRGAYLAAFSVVMVYGILKHRRLLIAGVLVLVLWQVVLPSSVVERIQMTETDTGALESSAAVRLNLWNNAINMFEQYPLFGSGFKGFTLAYKEERWSDTHNFYLKTLAEQGIIGVSLLAIILLAAIRSGWRLFKAGNTPFQKGLGYGFLGCVIAHIVTNMFGDRWSYYEMGSYFWIFWGIVDRGILITKASKGQAKQVANVVPAVGKSNA